LLFQNKKVIITGHTGFKGSWLSCVLSHLGAKVIGISLDVPTQPSLYKVLNFDIFIEDFRVDICNYELVSKVISEFKPDYVFHLAAQSLVSVSYEDPLKTMTTNAIGTANILESLRLLTNNVVAVFITSDKAYYNSEWVYGYRENDKLGGYDPYSASKAMAELAINSFYNSFLKNGNTNIKIGIARAGNVIGGGDWAKDRLIPDCIKSWSVNKEVEIRSPKATRPWQHVLEPLSGYLTLASLLSKNNIKPGEAYNFGPSANQNRTVLDLLNEMSNYWKDCNWKITAGAEKPFYEAGLLKLNCDKALVELDWKSTLNFEETISMTINWYKYFYQNKENMEDFTMKQITKYFSLAKSQKLNWLKCIEK
jgi:CDP-glucose 4,6-dehydratase